MMYPDNFLIEDIQELSTRVKNSLANDDITTVGAAKALSDGELMRMPNFGKVSLAELRAVVGPNSGKAACDPYSYLAKTVVALIYGEMLALCDAIIKTDKPPSNAAELAMALHVWAVSVLPK